MTLFNHLFGQKKDIAKELVMDDEKRISLWKEHLDNYETRERLCKHFNFANVDKALEDFSSTDDILKRLESLISPELVHISDEEKTDEEILSDLARLKSVDDIDKINHNIVITQEKGTDILKIFIEIHDVLKAELHLIKTIRKGPKKELLLKLFRMIFNQEGMLYKTFKEQTFQDKNRYIHANITRIARAIILEEELHEEVDKDIDEFARVMIEEMHSEESTHWYRKLGEAIYLKLAEISGGLMQEGEDITHFIKRIEELIEDKELMYRTVKELRPKYDDIKINRIIFAFHRAYHSLHFDTLENNYYRNNFEE